VFASCCLLASVITIGVFAQPPADPPPAAITIEAGPAPQLGPNANLSDAITVTAKAGGTPKAGVKIRAVSDNDIVKVYTSGDPDIKADATTDANGVAKFSVFTKSVTPPTTNIRFFVMNNDNADQTNFERLTLSGLSTAPAAATIFDVKPVPKILPNRNQPDAIKIAVTKDAKPVVGLKIHAASDQNDVHLYGDTIVLTKTDADATTDSTGVAKFSVVTKTASPPPTKVRLMPIGAGNAPDLTNSQIVDLTPSSPAANISYVVSEPPQLRPNSNQSGAIKVTAKMNDQPKAGIKIRGVSDSENVLLMGDDKKSDKTATATTDASGVATFSVLTTTDQLPKSTTVRLIPLGDDGTADGENTQLLTLTPLPTHEQTLGSKLSYLQLFTGTTFTNNYDDSGNSKGFGNGGPIIRLTFDTMWKHQRVYSPRSAQPLCSDMHYTERQKIEAQCYSSEKVPNLHAFSDGAWHTDLNVEFTKFPFGIDRAATTTPELSTKNPDSLSHVVAADSNDTATNGPLENAFSGTVGATWQPNRWSHYDERENVTADEPHYDAYRWEAFGKAGVTTRAQQASFSKNQNTDRIEVGFRFTHRRSYKPNAVQEDRNLEPIRFIEISAAGFSNWQGKQHARRIVIDAGLRLGALSNNIFPVYLGAHMNTGPGPDDLRVFIGVLMKLDKLATLVKNAGGSTGE
jgi:hypothetical protein